MAAPRRPRQNHTGGPAAQPTGGAGAVPPPPPLDINSPAPPPIDLFPKSPERIATDALESIRGLIKVYLDNRKTPDGKKIPPKAIIPHNLQEIQEIFDEKSRNKESSRNVLSEILTITENALKPPSAMQRFSTWTGLRDRTPETSALYEAIKTEAAIGLGLSSKVEKEKTERKGATP